MTGCDLTPLARFGIGFDRFLSDLENMSHQVTSASSYPPHNIEKTGDNTYRITMALAGFGPEDIEISTEDSVLTIRGKMTSEDKTMLHRGIASRAFERRFTLAEYMVVDGASMNKGMLNIFLKRELPEKAKPRSIHIDSSVPTTKEETTKEETTKEEATVSAGQTQGECKDS
jgi:molecular chaperone IbpA